MTTSSTDVLTVGAAPLISACCREIRLAEMVNEMVRWDREQWSVSPGDLLVAMIVNLLIDRAPLFRIRDFYQNRDLDLIFGPGKMTLEALNDRHFGVLLERLFEANPEQVYHSLTASAVMVHQVDLKSLHSDTTSKSVQGAYDYPVEVGGFKIAQGHSKDHRPDLKQFLYGLIVSEGVPVAGKVMDGNKSDKAWNREIIEELARYLSPKIAQQMLYVADSAMVTPGSLNNASDRIKFVTRLPETYKLVQQLKQEALIRNQWEFVGPLNAAKDAAVYKFVESTATLYERTYRFLVVHSSALAAKKKVTQQRRIEKEKEKLQTACLALQKQEFACEPDAQAAWNSFLHQHRDAYHQFIGEVYEQQRKKKRDGRGRPSADDVAEFETVWKVACRVGPVKEEKAQEELREDQMFILMTNELDPSTLPGRDMLIRYKGQITVETRFRWLKDPTVVKQVWLNTPNRVMALGFVFLIGLLIYCLMERRIRKNLSAGNKAIRLQGNRLSKKPTAMAFLQLFTDIVVMWSVDAQGNVSRKLPGRYSTPELSQALQIAGFDIDLYTNLPE